MLGQIHDNDLDAPSYKFFEMKNINGVSIEILTKEYTFKMTKGPEPQKLNLYWDDRLIPYFEKTGYQKILYLAKVNGEIYILDANFDLLKGINNECRELKKNDKEFDKRKLKFKITVSQSAGSKYPVYSADAVSTVDRTEDEINYYTDELIEIGEALAKSYKANTDAFLGSMNVQTEKKEDPLKDFPVKPGTEEVDTDQVIADMEKKKDDLPF